MGKVGKVEIVGKVGKLGRFGQFGKLGRAAKRSLGIALESRVGVPVRVRGSKHPAIGRPTDSKQSSLSVSRAISRFAFQVVGLIS